MLPHLDQPDVKSENESAWAQYVADERSPWNLKRVVHLHRRAAFAAPWDTLQADLKSGPQEAVGRLLNNQTDSRDEFETLAATIGDAAIASSNPDRLKAWWLFRMLKTSDPLTERLTLMWHNHFATSNVKVKNLTYMLEQNNLLRQNARSDFGSLLAAVVKHPAMLVWLDADANRKGRANENLSRELMELFTLGIGNYSEQDVKAAAKALTGWTVTRDRFENRVGRHDDSELALLGLQKKFNGDELLEMLTHNPATARRIAWRICDTFMGEDVVGEKALSELAKGLSNKAMDIGWAVETVLRSKLFFSESNLRSRVISPVESVVGTLRALQLNDPPPGTITLADWVTKMGQDLFYPPNVSGWNGGRSWLGTRTIVARANFANALAMGGLNHPAQPPDFGNVIGAMDLSQQPVNEVASSLAKLFWGEGLSGGSEDSIAAFQEKMKDKSEAQQFAAVVELLLSRPEHLIG